MQLWRRFQTFWIRVWMTRRCEYVYNCWRQGWTRRLLPLWSGSWGGSPLPLRSDPGLVAWVKHYHTLPTKFIFKSIVVVAYIPGHLFTLHPGHFKCWYECNCTVTSFPSHSSRPENETTWWHMAFIFLSAGSWGSLKMTCCSLLQYLFHFYPFSCKFLHYTLHWITRWWCQM